LTFPQRHAEIGDVVDKAVATGRCVFMSGARRTYNYPAEVAQASDMVISLLYGGTAALESYLSGTRVVYLDLEGCYHYPEYAWGKDLIVFDDLEKLISAINDYRSDSARYDALGNVRSVPTLSSKDQFMDGMASGRMARYIGSLFEEFDKGRSRKDAMHNANAGYSKAWGDDKVVESEGVYA
jgi:hypothetical protein